MNLPRREEGGFTLIELLISIVLLSLLTGATASALITALNQSRTNTQRVREANDAQVIAAYLVRDAQATGGSDPATGLSDPALGVSTTDAAGCTASGALVARFQWRDYFLQSGRTSQRHVAAYFYDSSSNTLVRAACTDGGAASLVSLGSNIGSTPQPPTLTCDGSGTCPHFPDTVQLTLYETNNPVTHAPGPYQVVLTASLRPESQTAASTSNSTPVPLLALGGSAGCVAGAAGLDIEGTPLAQVYGTVDVNTTDLGCGAMNVAGSATYKAGGTSILIGGTCSGCASPPGSYPNAIADPFASLTPPSATCGGGSNPAPVGGHYPPGTYPQLLTLSGNFTFDPGTYVFCNGVAVTGGTITGTGVLWYFKGGTLTASGTSTTTLTAAAGAYNPLVVWQAAGNTAMMSTAGGAALNFNGTLYVPNAVVDLGGNANSSFTSIVAMTVRIRGTHTIIIGTPPATPLSITGPATLPQWTRGVAYPATTVTATGGSGTNTWSASGLPTGMTINATTGVVSGTPTTSGTVTVTVNVLDSLGDTASKPYTLTINAPPTVSGPASLPVGTVGVAYPATTVTASGGTAPLSWSATQLPPGLGINPATGAITGTPTTAGSFSATVTVTDSTGATGSRAYTVTIKAAPTVTSTSPSSRGQGATNAVVTINGTGFVSGASLSASFSGTGITVNSVTFVSATQVTTNITIAASAPTGARNVVLVNGDGSVATGTGVFTVNPAPTVTSISPPSRAKGTSGSETIVGTGFAAGATVTFVPGGANPGGNAPTVTVTTVNSGTQITVTITIANGNPARGTYDVVVTNPDGGRATLPGGFTVT